MIDLWLVDLDRLAPALEAAELRLALLPVATATTRVVSGERRTAAIALRLALARRIGSAPARRPFAIAAAGKPSLPGSGVAFSLAHTGGAALIALSTAGLVGVDIERERPVAITVARRAAIETAAAAIADGIAGIAGDDRRFLAGWTALEAVAKASGAGIAAVLADLGARHGDHAGCGVDARAPHRPDARHRVGAASGSHGTGIAIDGQPFRVSILALAAPLVGAICRPRDAAIPAILGGDDLVAHLPAS